MNLSQIIGTEVFSIYDKSEIGVIYSVQINKTRTKIDGFFIFDADENEFYLPFKNLLGINNFVTIKNIEQLSNLLPESNLNPLGKKVISIDGQDYGKITDIIFEKDGKITALKTSQKDISLTEIASMGDIVILGEKTKVSNYKPKKNTHLSKITAESNFSVKIMSFESSSSSVKISPPKLTINSNYLVGKKAKTDLIGLNNELIVKKNQIITEKMIEMAKIHNKFNQLYYSCY